MEAEDGLANNSKKLFAGEGYPSIWPKRVLGKLETRR
jgi:hypothetical protein